MTFFGLRPHRKFYSTATVTGSALVFYRLNHLVTFKTATWEFPCFVQFFSVTNPNIEVFEIIESVSCHYPFEAYQEALSFLIPLLQKIISKPFFNK